MKIFSYFLIFFLSLSFLKIYIFKFGKKIVDSPNLRSSHSNPTPTGGGISFVLITIIYSSFNNYYVPLISMPLALVGFIDDRFKLTSKFRYIIQLFTVTSIIIHEFYRSNLMQNIESNYLLFCGILIIFLIIFGTALINFINFMDGIDGLVCSTMLVVFITGSFFLENTFSPLIISLLAFLIFNWHPAKIFMGDIGSTFIGALYFSLLLKCGLSIETLGLLLINTPLIMDAFTCIVRRYFMGQNIFTPHRLHLYQRLVQAGWKHSDVTLLYLLMTLLGMLFFLNSEIITLIIFSLITLFLGYYLDQTKAKKFIEC